MLFVITALEEPGIESHFHRIAQFASDRGAIVIGVVVTRSGDEIVDINALQAKFDLLLILDEQSTPAHYCSNPIEFALLVTEKIAEITEGNGIK